MSKHRYLVPALIGLFLGTSISAFSQVAPSATAGWPLGVSAGVGLSSFNMDWGRGEMFGGAFWIDGTLNEGPSFLRGLGAEIEARDISLHRGANHPSNFRTDTAGGGPIYTFRRYRNFRPYVKFIMSDGNIDFQIPGSVVTHINWTVYAPGGGLEYRVHKRIWVRADYEFQAWDNVLHDNKILDPQGFTFGVTYDLKANRAY